jgi:uncharacterized ubiquitin-like protein YukD
MISNKKVLSFDFFFFVFNLKSFDLTISKYLMIKKIVIIFNININ